MFTHIGTFLIDQWLWNITWGWYHIPLSIVLMVLFFKFFLRINIIASVLLSLSAAVSSFILFSGFVVGLLIYVFRFTYQEALQGHAMVADPLHACLYIALLYTILESVFFVILNKYYPIARLKVIAAAFIANLLAAGLVYLVLPKGMI